MPSQNQHCGTPPKKQKIGISEGRVTERPKNWRALGLRSPKIFFQHARSMPSEFVSEYGLKPVAWIFALQAQRIFAESQTHNFANKILLVEK